MPFKEEGEKKRKKNIKNKQKENIKGKMKKKLEHITLTKPS